MTERPLCPDCVAFWAKHTRVNADGEAEVDTVSRGCACRPPKGPALSLSVAVHLTEGQARVDALEDMASRLDPWPPGPLNVTHRFTKEPA